MEMLTVLFVMWLGIKLIFRLEYALSRKTREICEQLRAGRTLKDAENGVNAGASEEFKKLTQKAANRGCTIFIVGFFLSWLAGYWVAESMNRFFPAELVQISSARLAPFGGVGEKNKPYFLGVSSVANSKLYFYIPETSETDVYKPAVTLFGEGVTIHEEDRESGRVVIYAKRPPCGAFLFSIPDPIPPGEEKQYRFQIPKGSQKELFGIE